MSLNGVSTIEEINEMIFLQLAGTTSQLAFQGMKLLGKYGGGLSTIIPLPESMLEKAFEKFGEGIASKIQSDKIEGLKDIILCFDDLERIDDKLSMKQIFGFINSNFIEHNNLKVIFISNEKEIKDESYEIIKEKVIGRTLKYVQSKNNVFEEIVNSVYKDNEYLMNFYEVEADNLKLSIDLLFENINLRALRFILDTFCILQEKGYELAQDDTEFIILSKSLFLNVLIISNEYKGGKFKKIDQLENLYNSPYIYSFGEEGSYEKDFLNKYHKINSYIDKNVYYFKSVSRYILEGYIVEDFEKELSEFLSTRVVHKTSEGNNPINILNDFMLYDDEKNQQAQLDILEKINQKEYLIGDYLNIYLIFKRLENMDLILIQDDYMEIIDKGFNEALELWEGNNEFDFFKYNLDGNDEKIVRMIEAIRNKNKMVQNEERRKNIEVWINALSADNVESSMYKNIEYEKEFFKILIDIGLHKNIDEYNNAFISYLKGYLNHKYLRQSNAGTFYGESELIYISKFEESINDILIEKDLKKTRKVVLETFLEELIKVREHLVATSKVY